MPLPKSKLLRLKRDLVSARILIQESAGTRKEGEGEGRADVDLPKHLRLIADHISYELDYLEVLSRQV